jgi:ABC-type sugar transport system ATPase subunit
LTGLTIVQNVYLGIEEKTKWKNLNRRAMERKVKELLSEMNITIDVNTMIRDLPIVLRQMVAVVKAIIHEAKILIMDEPSSSLTNRELEVLFDLIRKLKSQNITVIYVSHRLEEIFQICDSVTVLLDGHMVLTEEISSVSKDQIIEKMIGRKVYESRLNTRRELTAPYLFEANNLSYKNSLHSVSFKIKKGEIYGILGLVGSGIVDLGKIFYGIKQPSSGNIVLNGKSINLPSPFEALKNSISYVSDDRRTLGVFLEMSVEDNGTIAALRKFLFTRVFLLLNESERKKIINEYIEKLKIKTRSITQNIRYLSGGNQQKLMIARSLINDTEIIVLNSPTKGIDVGAKFDIYQILMDCIFEGKTVIVISQEITELVHICDRILMLKKGNVFKEYSGKDLSEELIYSDLLK